MIFPSRSTTVSDVIEVNLRLASDGASIRPVIRALDSSFSAIRHSPSIILIT